MLEEVQSATLHLHEQAELEEMNVRSLQERLRVDIRDSFLMVRVTQTGIPTTGTGCVSIPVNSPMTQHRNLWCF